MYFMGVKEVPPIELLAHRIVWSVVLLVVVITLMRRWPDVGACLEQRRTRWMLLASTVLIATNWFVFIHGVSTGQVVQNSLGYFVNPLLNILLGVLLFHERLRVAQWCALGLASLGLGYLVLALGEVPWIALFLASSFAAYGVLRKIAPVDALIGLTVETMLLLPVASIFLVLWAWHGSMAFLTLGPGVDALILASGAVTCAPLLLFGAAARRLPLSTLGFLQYLAPTMQFLLAVLHLGEPFLPAQQVSFGLIWSALALVIVDGLLARRVRAPLIPEGSPRIPGRERAGPAHPGTAPAASRS